MATRVRKNEKNVSAADFAKAIKTVGDSGGTLQDIADMVGISVGSVSTRLYNWRKNPKLKDKVPSFAHNRGGAVGRTLDVDAIAAILEG